MSNSLWPHGLQHARLPCPSLFPELAQTQVHWVSDAIQPSHSLSSPSPPAFNLSQHQRLSMSRFFSSGGQSIGASVSASVLPVNIQGWFPLGWTGWIYMPSCLPSTDGRILSVLPEFWTFTVMCLCGSFIHYSRHSVGSFHLEIYILQLWGDKNLLNYFFDDFLPCHVSTCLPWNFWNEIWKVIGRSCSRIFFLSLCFILIDFVSFNS